MEKKTIGFLIKRGRKKLKLSQKELGIMIGVSQSTIVGWEEGRTEPLGGALVQVIKRLDLLVDFFPEEIRKIEKKMGIQNKVLDNNIFFFKSL